MSLAIALIGLVLLTAFSQTAKHLTVGPISAIGWLLGVPMLVALVWSGAREIGWGMVLAFVVTSLLAGVINGMALRAGQKGALYALQPVEAVLSLACAIGTWLVK
jgi:hypothetical protein